MSASIRKSALLATACGAKAIELIREGAKNRAVGDRNGEIFDMDLEEALAEKRVVDLDLYKGVDVLSM